MYVCIYMKLCHLGFKMSPRTLDHLPKLPVPGIENLKIIKSLSILINLFFYVKYSLLFSN